MEKPTPNPPYPWLGYGFCEDTNVCTLTHTPDKPMAKPMTIPRLLNSTMKNHQNHPPTRSPFPLRIYSTSHSHTGLILIASWPCEGCRMNLSCMSFLTLMLRVILLKMRLMRCWMSEQLPFLRRTHCTNTKPYVAMTIEYLNNCAHLPLHYVIYWDPGTP